VTRIRGALSVEQHSFLIISRILPSSSYNEKSLTKVEGQIKTQLLSLLQKIVRLLNNKEKYVRDGQTTDNIIRRMRIT